MKRFLAPFLLLAVVACGTTGTPESDLWAACKTFIGTEQALRPYKAKMSDEQVAAVSEAVSAAKPICTGGVEITSARDALRVVNAHLAQMLAIQNEVQ